MGNKVTDLLQTLCPRERQYICTVNHITFTIVRFNKDTARFVFISLRKAVSNSKNFDTRNGG